MPRREKDSLKTVQTQFCGHHTPNNQGQVSTQDLRQDSNDFNFNKPVCDFETTERKSHQVYGQHKRSPVK